jgi:hypothetical protein
MEFLMMDEKFQCESNFFEKNNKMKTRGRFGLVSNLLTPKPIPN